ncbi:hypothetical protein VFPPC_16912 [Pochonia chlamydosporia 170]|uniref:Uncharacterized protein n=1 Tax=Pochonia chlamydosporia 170 TaxID=1380566 RepID=A0A179F164_METCM|nr:hypothetical protein VFPPC_16912 [Pochonia chlamydosporia 170]OAQ58990.1 hypothetical protein VFPPC_16912 [Pochonia chlamydosporia 170]
MVIELVECALQLSFDQFALPCTNPEIYFTHYSVFRFRARPGEELVWIRKLIPAQRRNTTVNNARHNSSGCEWGLLDNVKGLPRACRRKTGGQEHRHYAAHVPHGYHHRHPPIETTRRRCGCIELLLFGLCLPEEYGGGEMV